MGDVHPDGNPHYWLDPRNGAIVAQQRRRSAGAGRSRQRAQLPGPRRRRSPRNARPRSSARAEAAEALPSQNGLHLPPLVDLLRRRVRARGRGHGGARARHPADGAGTSPSWWRSCKARTDSGADPGAVLLGRRRQVPAREAGLRVVVGVRRRATTPTAGSYLAHFDGQRFAAPGRSRQPPRQLMEPLSDRDRRASVLPDRGHRQPGAGGHPRLPRLPHRAARRAVRGPGARADGGARRGARCRARASSTTRCAPTCSRSA